ncbi:MAG: hypothetical protein LBT00_10705 [Spirochaetaceae bacterium]|nr:hypothetical protein [Spirochaetaceae bacterium]
MQKTTRHGERTSRHCERSEAIQRGISCRDCFVANGLATDGSSPPPRNDGLIGLFVSFVVQFPLCVYHFPFPEGVCGSFFKKTHRQRFVPFCLCFSTKYADDR